MLQYGMQPENLAAVRLGVASHNLFTLAYGLVLAAAVRTVRRACSSRCSKAWPTTSGGPCVELAGDMLLYAPACRQEEFINAIGYLVRRLDENTGPDNFLRHAFNLEVDGPEWRRLEQGFVDSFARIETLSATPRRTQDQESGVGAVAAAGTSRGSSRRPQPSFTNEPDTDWSLPQNSAWAEAISSLAIATPLAA